MPIQSRKEGAGFRVQAMVFILSGAQINLLFLLFPEILTLNSHCDCIVVKSPHANTLAPGLQTFHEAKSAPRPQSRQPKILQGRGGRYEGTRLHSGF